MNPPSSPNVLDLTTDELRVKFNREGISEAYRAEQVQRWIFEKGVYDFDRMSDLSVSLRAKLKQNFLIGLPAVLAEQRSKDDKSVKLLLSLEKGDIVETVMIPAADRRTVCVSSQVGCKFHCAFCASGQGGFSRNLRMGEILAQVLMARDRAPEKKITHLVFMGIGEPFDNYRELLRSVRMLNSKTAFGIGARKITISTCGVVPKIDALAGEGLQVELSVSLHGANDAVRGAIMPVNKAYPVKSLIEACKRYAQNTKRAITFEYILVKGVNASVQDAVGLAKLLSATERRRISLKRHAVDGSDAPFGGLCKVNLIPYNPIEEFPHVAPSYAEVVAFQQVLQKNGVKATVRFSKGRDIQAACGQLRSRHASAVQ